MWRMRPSVLFFNGFSQHTVVMKVKCPDCKEEFDLDKNAYDEGDSVECPECGASCIIEVKRGKFVLKKESAKYFEEEDDFQEDD